ncbi:MAG: insulinase family protein [Gammaproteobacteria bacterium]|nr:insulinase family protein [Gammaproteobacteria bacterium]
MLRYLKIRQLFVAVALLLLCGLSSGVLAASNVLQSWTTGNGVKVNFFPSDSLPMVDLRMVYAAGSARDGDKPGVADMTSAVIGNGADGLDANSLSDKLESMGAQFEIGSLRDMAWVSLRSLTLPELLDGSLDIMAKVIGKPDFPESEIELMRAQLLTMLKNRQQKPGEIAEKAFFEAVYGDHPYARTAEEADINAIKRDDIVDFYQRYYVTGNAQLSIVGQLDRAQAEALAEKLVRFMPTGDKAPALPPVEPLAEARTIRIDYPSEQSHILIGQPGVSRNDADYFALYIANHGFGGSGFSSILMDEVREKRGLAYSVYSYFSPMEKKGPFMIGLQTRNDQVDEAISIVTQNLDEYIKDGPTEKAFESSIKNITGGYALKTDSNAKLVQYASLIGFYDLPLDYLQAFNDRIERETRDSVHQAFRETIRPDKLVTVIVGGAPE